MLTNLMLLSDITNNNVDDTNNQHVIVELTNKIENSPDFLENAVNNLSAGINNVARNFLCRSIAMCEIAPSPSQIKIIVQYILDKKFGYVYLVEYCCLYMENISVILAPHTIDTIIVFRKTLSQADFNMIYKKLTPDQCMRFLYEHPPPKITCTPDVLYKDVKLPAVFYYIAFNSMVTMPDDFWLNALNGATSLFPDIKSQGIYITAVLSRLPLDKVKNVDKLIEKLLDDKQHSFFDCFYETHVVTVEDPLLEKMPHAAVARMLFHAAYKNTVPSFVNVYTSKTAAGIMSVVYYKILKWSINVLSDEFILNALKREVGVVGRDYWAIAARYEFIVAAVMRIKTLDPKILVDIYNTMTNTTTDLLYYHIAETIRCCMDYYTHFDKIADNTFATLLRFAGAESYRNSGANDMIIALLNIAEKYGRMINVSRLYTCLTHDDVNMYRAIAHILRAKPARIYIKGECVVVVPIDVLEFGKYLAENIKEVDRRKAANYIMLLQVIAIEFNIAYNINVPEGLLFLGYAYKYTCLRKREFPMVFFGYQDYTNYIKSCTETRIPFETHCNWKNAMCAYFEVVNIVIWLHTESQNSPEFVTHLGNGDYSYPIIYQKYLVDYLVSNMPQKMWDAVDHIRNPLVWLDTLRAKQQESLYVKCQALLNRAIKSADIIEMIKKDYAKYKLSECQHDALTMQSDMEKYIAESKSLELHPRFNAIRPFLKTTDVSGRLESRRVFDMYGAVRIKEEPSYKIEYKTLLAQLYEKMPEFGEYIKKYKEGENQDNVIINGVELIL